MNYTLPDPTSDPNLHSVHVTTLDEPAEVTGDGLAAPITVPAHSRCPLFLAYSNGSLVWVAMQMQSMEGKPHSEGLAQFWSPDFLCADPDLPPELARPDLANLPEVLQSRLP